MVDLSNAETIVALRQFLESISMAEVMESLRSQSAGERGWPAFHRLSAGVEQLPAEVRPAYELLVLGSEVPADRLRAIMGRVLTDGLERAGVLQPLRDGVLSTAGRGILPLDGFFFYTDLPNAYPTAPSKRPRVSISPEALLLRRMLPSQRRGTVLEVSCGTGLLSIMASATARQVVAFDREPEAVNVARFNAVLNLVQECVDVRQGEVSSAREEGLVDLVIANLSGAFMREASSAHRGGGSGAEDVRHVSELLRQVAPRLGPAGRVLIMADCPGDENGPAGAEELARLKAAHGWNLQLLAMAHAPASEYLWRHVEGVEGSARLERMLADCAERNLTHYWTVLVRLLPAGEGRLRVLETLAPRVHVGNASFQAGIEMNEALLARARRAVAGGDSSYMRVLPYAKPLIASRGKGCRLWDAGGREYIDFNMAYGPLVFGHRPERIVQRVARQIQEAGSQLGFQSEVGIRAAEKLQRLFPSMELLRFANSGTEADASALRLARAYTGRRKVILFEGHYHGWSDSLFHRYHAPLEQLSQEGFGEAIPGTLGLNGAPRDALVVRFNQPEALERCLEAHRGDVAAIILEPVMGNAGVIPPAKGFLETVRSLATAHGALLIFDEVITGMRVAAGGAQERYGVRPDLTVLSKVMGSGFPVAAFGGSREIMQWLAEGKAFHGGVYSANAASMAAVEAVLDEIAERGPELYTGLYRTSDAFAAGLRDIFGRLGIPHVVQSVGPMVGVFVTDGRIDAIREYRDARRHGALERYVRFQHRAQSLGVYFHPNMLEPLFISTEHGPADIAAALERIEESARCLLES